MAETQLFNRNCAGDWNEKGMKNFQGDFMQARRDFARAIALEPFHSKYYHNHGRKNLSLDKFEEALADFTTVMRLTPEDDDSCHYRGVAYFFLGHYELALACFEEAIRLMEKNSVPLIPPTVDWAWMACMRMGKPEQARALLERYIYPEIPCGESDMDYKWRTLLYMGHITPEAFESKIDLHCDVDAITCYYGLANYYRYVAVDEKKCQAALERTLSFPTAHNAFAYKLALLDTAQEAPNTKKGEKAMETTQTAELEAYLKDHPEDDKKWFELGMLYFETNFTRARECFSMALAQEPFNVDYRFNRGRKALSDDDFEEALADFSFCTRIDAKDGFKWHYLANAYFFLGMYEQAIEYYQKAMERHEANGIALVPPAVDWIFMSYMRAGQSEKAKAFVRAHTSADMPVEDSDLSYKKRILLYAGITDIDTYLSKVVNYNDALDAITELYGAVVYYRDIANDPQRAAEYVDKVLAYDEYHYCFAYKLALIDKAAMQR